MGPHSHLHPASFAAPPPPIPRPITRPIFGGGSVTVCGAECGCKDCLLLEGNPSTTIHPLSIGGVLEGETADSRQVMVEWLISPVPQY